MRSIHFVLAASLAAAACSGDGGEPIARPDQLRLSIVRGAAQTGQVRAATGPALHVAGDVAPDEVLPEPVVVRISAVGGASRGVGATGPSFLEIPNGAAVNWRIVGPTGCGAPFALVTTADGADSVVNYWRRGTVAGVECRMVAEGIVGGVAFGSDTATATFTPGAPSGSYDTGASGITTFPLVVGPHAVQDAHGNSVPFRIEGNELFSVAGAESGTADARTVTFLGATTDRVQYHVLRLLDAEGEHVGNLLVTVASSGNTWWRATGLGIAIDR